MKIRTRKDGRCVVHYVDAEGKEHRLVVPTKNPKEALKLAKQAKIPEMEQLAQVGALSRRVFTKLVQVSDIKVQDAMNEFMDFVEVRRTFNTWEVYCGYIRVWSRWLKKNHPGLEWVSELSIEHVLPWINEAGVRLPVRNMRLYVSTLFLEHVLSGQYTMNIRPRRDLFVDHRSMPNKDKLKRLRPPFSPEDFFRLSKTLEEYVQKPWSAKHMVPVDKPLNDSAVRRRVREIKELVAPAVQLAYWSGLRLSDICQLQWSMYDGKTLIVQTIKSGVWVALPLDHEMFGSGTLIEVLDSLPRNPDSDYVFWKYASVAKTTKGVRLYVLRVFRFFEVPNHLSFHSLRHSFIHRLKESGVSLEDIARYVGHRNTDVTEGYLMK
jgi:integrase